MAISETWVDPDDAPEFGQDYFDHGTVKKGDQVIRRGRGRPTGSDKDSVSIRIDRDVLDQFKAGGPGWQSRMNEALRKAAGL